MSLFFFLCVLFGLLLFLEDWKKYNLFYNLEFHMG